MQSTVSSDMLYQTHRQMTQRVFSYYDELLERIEKIATRIQNEQIEEN